MRLRGSGLMFARVVCVVGVVAVLVIFFASIPPYFAQLRTLCPGTFCPSGQLSRNDLRGLYQLGLSLNFYASYEVAIIIISTLIWCGVAALLFWRKSDDLMALFTAFTLVMFAGIQGFSLYALPTALQWLVLLMRFLGSVSIGLFFYLFPSGRFEPRWTRWLAIASVVFWGFSIYVSAPLPPSNFFFWLDFVLFIGWVASVVIVQVYRYRRVSSSVQRQQTKWVVFGAALALGGYLGVVTPGLIFPSLQQGVIGNIFLGTAFGLFLLFIPLSIGFAILRSRLWDIDVIINKTLIFGLLTGSLVLVYFGLITVLQFLLRSIIRQNNDVAIVVSTLAIAALFHPFRRRIQAIIDRRFYRRKYDAARTLATFSATLRNEVDLDQLREELVAVVQETMQPSQVSLWLRPAQQDRKPQTTWSNPPPVSSEGR
jgi:hypothetical protein